MTEAEVLCCGVIVWRPPAGNEGLELGYVVRIFDGPSYETSLANGYRRIQRLLGDIGRHWARADDIPTDGRTVYADVSCKFC